MREFCVNLADLPNIKTNEVSQLSSFGIYTNLDLLTKITNQEQKIYLAQKIGVNIKYLSKLLVLANLSRLPRVGSQYCGLILHSGVISVKHLSEIPPYKLHRQILRLQVATLQRKDLCPSINLVKTWIYEAQILKN